MPFLFVVTLTFDLWHWHSSSSDRGTKHVFPVNLAQIPRYFIHEQKATDSAKNRTVCSSLRAVMTTLQFSTNHPLTDRYQYRCIKPYSHVAQRAVRCECGLKVYLEARMGGQTNGVQKERFLAAVYIDDVRKPIKTCATSKGGNAGLLRRHIMYTVTDSLAKFRSCRRIRSTAIKYIAQSNEMDSARISRRVRRSGTLTFYVPQGRL